jgi:hypothetical protein
MVGDGVSIAVVGALNVSPESFFAGSIVTRGDQLLRAAQTMVQAGAALLDVGAMSTAPYLPTRISEAEEADRLGSAVGLLAGKIDVPISADTSRSLPAQRALEAGAAMSAVARRTLEGAREVLPRGHEGWRQAGHERRRKAGRDGFPATHRQTKEVISATDFASID